MIDVVVVRVDELNNIYYLSPNMNEVKVGEKIVFQNKNGLFIGTVIKGNYSENKDNLVLPLDRILRIATEEDLNKHKKNMEIANNALIDVKKISKELKLDMNFIDCYFNLSKEQMLFNFLSEGRVDFRDLAKKMAQKYHTRIEFRQIGVRDKAKKVGGIGPCGLLLCCNSFLTDFSSVSINMAKNQMIALNPSKINGVCGRLLCCLGYENDNYTELRKKLPNIGYNMTTSLGIGRVVSIDIFKRTYSVDLGDKGIIEFTEDNKVYGDN